MTNEPEEIKNADDGKTFINIYSKGLTTLGRALSHFTESQFEHPTFGSFNCMEGYWHYVGGDVKDERLHTAPGYLAKRIGSTIKKSYNPRFQELIMEGNRLKIESNPWLLKMFIESSLPFKHYYFADNGWITIPKASDWLCEGFETLRMELRAEAGLDPLP